ncbi:MAG TPA: 3-phosphoshikimate 1-carboxyvinyltransferase [Mycobacteriales bacterium]|nr:3-phosphoshikimate 1-carboxyvinyltransferase [Mycobacteriales bacterium]
MTTPVAPTAAERAWSAPTATSPVRGVVTVPGSKSLTNRLLVLAALADGPSTLRAPLRSRDSLLMAAALRALGVGIDDHGDDWAVTPAPLHGPAALDVGNAGTVARFLPAVAALADGVVTMDGDARVRERPLGPLLTALRTLGADIDGDALPITIRGRGMLAGGTVTIDASQSSQLVSGLLLAAPRTRDGVTVVHAGPPVPSAPHLEMTVACLRDAGATVETAPNRWRVEPGPLRGADVTVEPDLSSASAFLAAAVATGGEVRLAGWPPTTTQPGRSTPALLERMGATTSLGPDGLVVRGNPDGIRGVDADLRDNPEVVPAVTALAVLAQTPSRLRGIAHLRVQETDRLRALSEELGLLGADVRETEDGLEITPAPLHAPDRPLDPRADHRLAMAYAVVGLAVPGVTVDDVATVGKTVPDFTARWSALVGGPAAPPP